MKNQVQLKAIKIVFFGTSEFAVPALKSLVNFGYKISAVITQPEKPVGRARVILPSPIKKVALELNISVLEPHNLKNDEEFFKYFESLAPDVCVVAAYGKIIPSKYLEVPEYGFLNIHPSSLPKYRGPSPIQTAILKGDKEAAVVIIKIDEEMDHGPLLAITNYQLPITKNYKEVEQDLAKLGAELLIDTLPKYLNDEIKLTEQNHSEATYTKKFERPNGQIDWNNTAEEIYNLVRALNPEPGTWTKWKDKTLNLIEVEILHNEVELNYEPGAVVSVNNQIAVATKKCYLILKQIQLEGGKKMDVQAFINGHRQFLGSKLE